MRILIPLIPITITPIAKVIALKLIPESGHEGRDIRWACEIAVIGKPRSGTETHR